MPRATGLTLPGRLLVKVENVSVRYGKRAVLEAIDLEVREGEIVSIVGPNGGGKSTLVRLVLGIVRPSSGHVHRPTPIEVGYVPQRLHVDPTLPITVRRFLDLPRPFPRERSDRVLGEVRARDLRERAVQSLSGGEFQRVVLARALLAEPDLLVLDEPGHSVDFAGQADFFELIEQLRNQRRCGVLLVSHELHLVMAATDRVVCLNGHVCCTGQPEAIRLHPEYQALFGQRAGEALAVYRHHHDHRHDLHGDPVEGHGHSTSAGH